MEISSICCLDCASAYNYSYKTKSFCWLCSYGGQGRRRRRRKTNTDNYWNRFGSKQNFTITIIPTILGSFSLHSSHVIMMLHSNYLSALKYWQFKVWSDISDARGTTPAPRTPAGAWTRCAEPATTSDTSGGGSVCKPNAYYIFPNYVAKCPNAHTISYSHFWPQPKITWIE